LWDVPQNYADRRESLARKKFFKLTMAIDPKELDKLIWIGEGYTLEFKASPSHIAREIY